MAKGAPWAVEIPIRPLEIGGSTSIMKTDVSAWSSVHPGQQPLSFLLETEEGVRLYHPSDSDPSQRWASWPGLGDPTSFSLEPTV